MPADFSEKKLHKIGRIDQCVRDYFELNSSVSEIQAKELMPLFIKKGIFLRVSATGILPGDKIHHNQSFRHLLMQHSGASADQLLNR